ncbi:MAG: aldo/keto reductase [Planctomycetota bacterium]|nr:aldo/keto reductase [Planctomycetota bacterium]
MKYRKIAHGQLEISTVCMGCWALAGDSTWGSQEKADSIDTIRAAIDAGINFFDTAELYGKGYSEQILGEALGSDRDKVVIASKFIRSADPEHVTEACEESLINLRTDYIDLYHIHWPSRDVPFAETVRAMENLKSAGKVRQLAVCNFGQKDLADILDLMTPSANQLPYNLLWRAIEFEILPASMDAGVPVTCYSPIMQGLLTGKFRSADDVPEGRARTRLFSGDRPQAVHGEAGAEEETFTAIGEIADLADQNGLDMAAMALAWLIGRDGVASVIAGARSPEQIRHNATAGDLTLSDGVMTRLDEITQPLKQKMGPNADMWNTPSRMR